MENLQLKKRKSQMDQFLFALSPDDPIMKPIVDQFGFDGYGRFLAVLNHCQSYKIYKIDTEIIKRHAKTNIRGAKKLYPSFQNALSQIRNLEEGGHLYALA